MHNIIQKLLQYTCLLGSLAIFSSCQTLPTPQKEEPPVEIAILMPLQGLGAEYNELVKLGIKDGLKGNINVMSYDGSTEEQIQKSMQKIIAKKTKIILGPLYSKFTSIIGTEAEKNNIIIISMSNDPTLALSKLFVFGHAPMKQLDQLVNYYLDRRYENFIALLPAGKHSLTVNKILQAMIVRKNGTLVRSEFYNENSESIAKSITVVSDSVDNLNEIAENINKPVIFISDDAKNLDKLFSSISAHKLDKKAIIVSDNRADPFIIDDFDITFTGSLKIDQEEIIKTLKRAEAKRLSYMHLLAYDLGNLVVDYIGEKFDQEQFLAKLNSSKIFEGLSGKIHFVDSVAQRNYNILRKENGAYADITNVE